MALHAHTPNKYFTAGTGRNPFFSKYNFWMFVRSQSLIWGWRSPSAERISWHGFPGACGRHPWTQKLPISQPWRWADGSLVEKKQILDFWFAKILSWPKLDGNFSNFEMAFCKLHRHYIDEELSHWKFFLLPQPLTSWLLGVSITYGSNPIFHILLAAMALFLQGLGLFSLHLWCLRNSHPNHETSDRIGWCFSKRPGLWRYQEKQNQNNATKTKCQGRPVAFISKNIKEHLQQLLFTHPVLSKKWHHRWYQNHSSCNRFGPVAAVVL